MRNRIVPSSEFVGSSANFEESRSSCAIHHDYNSVESQVCLFGPERYESRYNYPLFIWLHSCDSSEAELEGVMPVLSLQNYVGCAPRGPMASSRGHGRFGWGKSTTAAAVAEELVFESLELANEQFSIDRYRVFLAGFGSGATMALRVALRYPERFAGVAAICGAFPNERQALSKLQLVRPLPILWLYGEYSRQCGIEQVCATLPMLHAAGLSLDIRQYPCGDALLSNMLGDTNHWLMQLVTRQPVTHVSTGAEYFSRN